MPLNIVRYFFRSLKRFVRTIEASLHDLHFHLLIRLMKGGLTPSEAQFLRRLSAATISGDILEVGSFQGMSAVALYQGLRTRTGGTTQQVYCIEPHRDFIGVYGGRFGPQDRAGFYRTMLLSGAYRNVALVSLASRSAARGWQRPLGLVFIDGDHTYEGVAADVRNWSPHLIPGGLLVFDDAKDKQIGPYQVIEEQLTSGDYIPEASEGKVVALRKLPSQGIPGPLATERPLRILVVANAIYMSGGMLRFERVGRVLAQQGHQMFFCTFEAVNKPPGWSGTLPVIDLEAAWGREWDITMLPGRAGFEEAGRGAWLRIFTDPRFGVRMQHILNDRTYESDFLALNREFRPHLVVFNNPEWSPGTFTQFSANEFHILEGAVEWQVFSACRSREQEEIVIGGQAQKNPWPLIAALDWLPEKYRLRLFGVPPEAVMQACASQKVSGRIDLIGTLTEAELPGYYSSLSVLVSTEENAGWSNMTAEAMAARVPVICTPAGTSAIAKDGDTALVIPHAEPAAIVEALKKLFGDAVLRESMVERANQNIQRYGWDDYVSRLLDIANRGRSHHYYWEPSLGLYGKWHPQGRLASLAMMFANMAGKSVLDVGSAEGVLAKACMDAGAIIVHGFDVDGERIDKARVLCGTGATFFVADLNQDQGILQDGTLLPAYDIVLYLGVHHHLDPAMRAQQLPKLLVRCSEMFALRTTEEIYKKDKLHLLMEENGFYLAEEVQEIMPSMGNVWIYNRT